MEMKIIVVILTILCIVLLVLWSRHKEETERTNNFCAKWDEKVDEAIYEIKVLKESTNYISDAAKKKYQKDYKDLKDAYRRLSKPTRVELIEKLVKYVSFEKEYENIDNTQYNHNETYFGPLGLKMQVEYSDIRSSKRFIGFHELKPFYNKWFDIINQFFSLNNRSKYKETSWISIYNTLYGYFRKGVQSLDEDRVVDNEKYKQEELRFHKQFFDTLLNYPLDDQQRQAIVTQEDNVLVVSSAGSGKTSTIVAKVQYLVLKKGIDPHKILVLTYTNKAAEELRARMGVAGVTCSTFHKHAMETLGQVTGSKPSIAENDIMHKIIEDLINSDETFLCAVNKYLTEYSNLIKDNSDYKTAAEFISDSEKYGLWTRYKDDSGSCKKVKSRQEWSIFNILKELGVAFKYEEPYPINTSTQYKRQYKPDFTIYYKVKEIDANGVEKEVKKSLYYEHYAIDAEGKVPVWFGDGKEGGLPKAQSDYENGIKWKRELHRENNTVLIETTSDDFLKHTDMSVYIEQLLNEHGVLTRHISEEEKLTLLKESNDKALKPLFSLINGFITLMKANNKTINEIIKAIDSSSENNERNKNIIQRVVQPVYEKYQQTLKLKGEYDFTEVLLDASKYCQKNNPHKYEYILVDEFQDISMDKYDYLKSLRTMEPFTKVFCVGDDWQSIYRFSGSDMTLFYDFPKYFGYTEECKIETTHRFGYPLLGASTVFIQENPEQKRKDVKTTYKGRTNIKFIPYENQDELIEIKKIVAGIPESESILILARYNFNGNNIGIKVNENIRNKAYSITINKRKIPFLTVHSSKGLEADNVIILNCESGTQGFPSLIEDDPILQLVLSGADKFENAEERRLFYVAITRARKTTYCLFNKTNPSPFISEFGEYSMMPGCTNYVCPRCNKGYVNIIKSGITTTEKEFVTVRCTRNSCDYYETLFDDKVQKYRPRHIVKSVTLQDLFNVYGNKMFWFKEQRLLLVEDIKKEIAIPLFLSINIAGNQYTWNDMYCNGVDYKVEIILYREQYISFLYKGNCEVYISDNDLDKFLDYIGQMALKRNQKLLDPINAIKEKFGVEWSVNLKKG